MAKRESNALSVAVVDPDTAHKKIERLEFERRVLVRWLLRRGYTLGEVEGTLKALWEKRDIH